MVMIGKKENKRKSYFKKSKLINIQKIYSIKNEQPLMFLAEKINLIEYCHNLTGLIIQ